MQGIISGSIIGSSKGDTRSSDFRLAEEQLYIYASMVSADFDNAGAAFAAMILTCILGGAGDYLEFRATINQS